VWQVIIKGEDWASVQAKAEMERKARVEARQAQLKSMASLPNRMKIHELVSTNFQITFFAEFAPKFNI
jgi:hypothetical protein